MCLEVVSESTGKTIDLCGGDFPKPEEGTEVKEKECCGGATGCGHGPVKEGSVQDASGAGLLQKEVRMEDASREKFLLLLIMPDGEYVVDIYDQRQTSFFQEVVAPVLKQYDQFNTRQADVPPFAPYPYGLVMVCAQKRGESLFYYHDLELGQVLRVLPWDLSRWRVEPLDGVV